MLSPRMCVTLVFFAITTPTILAQSPNMLSTFGDFQSINMLNPGFMSNYAYRDPASTTPLTVFDAGTYTYAPNLMSPILLHNNPALPNFFDHTLGNANGMMMIINGSTNPNDVILSATHTVQPNSTYTFSLWSTAWNNSGNHLPELQIKINGVAVGTAVPGSVLGQWTQFTVDWDSGSSTMAHIDLNDLNFDYGGNDFAIDDLSFSLSGNATGAAVPEPGTLALMGAALFGTGCCYIYKRRFKKADGSLKTGAR